MLQVKRVGWLTTAILLLTACAGLFGGSAQTGAEVDLQENGRIACTAACQERGQCGTRLDNSQVIFASSQAPAVENHDLLFPGGTNVTINTSSRQVLEVIATQEQFELPFYQVTTPDGQTGWVAGWCIISP
ncbi:MAG: SH3 domain-containing protein [Chloroflexi bacterium]|nr:MAG: SH3 domain-containing protein [Chloroflexota bacterium]